MAMYHKHRPAVFEEVVGQDGLVWSLKSRIKDGSLPHVVLFHGPSGTGKTTLARLCARALGCANAYDMTEINCADVRGIDSVRDIQEQIAYKSLSGGPRVLVMDEVVQLPKTTQQAALKVLEDVPAHVWFFLCTTSLEGLLPTFLGRCEVWNTRELSYPELKAVVLSVCKKEKVEVPEPAVVDMVCQHAAGSARQAVNLLEKVLSVSPEKRMSLLGRVLEESEPDFIARMIFQRKPWSSVHTEIMKLEDRDAEGVRRQVLAYASKVMSNKPQAAYHVILNFEQPFLAGRASLLRACWECLKS